MAEDLTFRSNYIEGVNKFQNVRGRAFWEEILSLITRQQNELMNFDEVRSRLHLHEEHYLGIQDVPLDQIVGSVGRYRDFTATFLPKYTRTVFLHQSHKLFYRPQWYTSCQKFADKLSPNYANPQIHYIHSLCL